MERHQSQTFFQKHIIRALIVGMVVWGVMAWIPPRVLVPFQLVLAPIVAPFQGGLSWVAFEVRDTVHFFSSISELKSENETLRLENQQLKQAVAVMPEIREENRLLREVVSLPERLRGKPIFAEVISRETRSEAASFTVNRGSTDGVQVGYPVVVGGGQLVGRVAAVQLTSARVHLLSHPDSTIAARIAGTSVQGVIRGDHGLGLIFDMALSGEQLELGAHLVTSGLGDTLPMDVYIGDIGAVRPSTDMLFQQAVVVTNSVESDIRFVAIIIPTP